MHDATRDSPAQRPVASAGVFFATFAAILGVIVALLALDLLLARVERSETRRQAADTFEEGRALLAAGRSADAADRLATAASLERDNIAYSLALADALRAEARTAEAEQILNRLLDRVQNDGLVNLTMARLLDATARPRDAKAFYHRAIYGRWGSDSITRRFAARFELIDLLVRQHAHEELLAELLPLQSAPEDSAAFLTRLAPLYLRAASPSRAAEAYRALLRHSPSDPGAYAGLGEAALALGQFQKARTAFRGAARSRPADSTIAERLRMVDTLLALDPTARGLSDAERLTRSQVLLARTISTLDACAASDVRQEQRAARDSARVELIAHVTRGRSALSAERNVERAEALWRARAASCDSTAGSGLPTNVLTLLQRVLAP